jgi:FkbM family methyltransferase
MTKRNPLLSLASWGASVFPAPLKRQLYRIRPLANLIRGSLVRAAPKDDQEIEVAAGPLKGVRLLLNYQSEKAYWLGTYEPNLTATIDDLVADGMVAYDVGANVGYISLLLARKVGSTGKVFAFEVLPENLQRMGQNIRLNDMQERIIVVESAVVESSRPVHFMKGPSNAMGKVDGSAGRDDVQYGESFDVPGVSLDSFVYESGNPAPQVIKMDIEGGEILAFPGMQRLIEEARPLILIELHGSEAAQVVLEAFEKHGYQARRMEAGYPASLSDFRSHVVGFPPGAALP